MAQKIFVVRLKKSTFRLPVDIAFLCKRELVTDDDIRRHYNRWNSMGIPCTFGEAARRALEDKRLNAKRK